MRALVIGGSGLFGKKTVLTLLRDPDFEKVVSLDVVAPPAGFLKNIEPFADRFAFVPGDISQLEDVLSAASTHGVDRMVNWAMILSQAPNPRLNTRVGLVGACNVWEAARLLGIKRVVYASSETVYGEQKDYGDREVTEDD
ncbi:MAG: NAD-dependent epimerase/dehydratase family protein, partial [bacterium]